MANISCKAAAPCVFATDIPLTCLAWINYLAKATDVPGHTFLVHQRHVYPWYILAAPLSIRDKVVTSDKCGSHQMIQALTSLTRESTPRTTGNGNFTLLRVKDLTFRDSRFHSIGQTTTASWQQGKMPGERTKLLQNKRKAKPFGEQNVLLLYLAYFDKFSNPILQQQSVQRAGRGQLAEQRHGLGLGRG